MIGQPSGLDRTSYAERIMVALDYQSPSEAEAALQSLAGTGCYVKVGMELFYAAGPHWIISLKERGYRVFLDVKMKDIPNTVKGAARSVTRLGVDMFNVHASGGKEMMEAAMEGVALGQSASAPIPIVIGVTQLTSIDEKIMNKEIGIPGTVEQTVLRYAELSRDSGLHGVVCSPWEVPMLKEKIGSTFLTVTPGIRPQHTDVGDQKRVAAPSKAFKMGSDYIVVGRAITQAPDIRAAFEAILNEAVTR
jgi:orotidine-5'-phosphate decarboxylase